MITTNHQAFTHGHQARFLSSGGLLVQCTPRWPLLACACENFFCVLEVNDVGVVDVTEVVDGDFPTLVDGEGEVKDADGDPSALKC